MSNQNIILFDTLSRAIFTQRILSKLDRGIPILNVRTVVGSLKRAIASIIYYNRSKSILYLCSDPQEALDVYHDLKFFLDSDEIVLLTRPKRYFKNKYQNDENLSWLIDGLNKILTYSHPVIITTPDVLDAEIPNPDQILLNKQSLKIGENLDFNEFRNLLGLNGFQRVDFVYEPGQFAVRGGIVDIFPSGMDFPFRVEFWGDEIESIREFNAVSQRSVKDHVSIEFISKLFHSENNVSDSNLIDYIESNSIIIIDSPDQIKSDFPANNFDFEKFFHDNQIIYFNGLGKADVLIKSLKQKAFSGSIIQFGHYLREIAGSAKEIKLFAEGKIHAERFKELVSDGLSDIDIDHKSLQLTPLDKESTLEKIQWYKVTPSFGFSIPDEGIHWFTEHQIFERMRFRDTTDKSKKGLTLNELKTLYKGDFVVHEDKGIAIFDGIETVTLGGNAQDCVRLIFAEGDILFLHLNYVHKIQKYSAPEHTAPKLSKLGSKEWTRRKDRAKKKLKDIARDLIKLYAERKMKPGYKFDNDTVWQKEFEASFIYEDTKDQTTATNDIKKDMESDTPMDRLVCGDVGFGKTEVALRAAFKAVQSGKQVAVLVPTTILAQQHYMTFKDRFQRYPVMTEVLSRFVPKQKQIVILERLKKGSVDILIGTHRILSKDIDFKDLGLVIIDEEQRFGVSAKEKLRQLKTNVDTLTLTATPIPRTLNFSLMGARDLSLIDTPPRNRLPVETEINQWNIEIVEKAIREEIEKGGQVYFVSDKVADLEKLMMDLKMQMSDLKFGLAHGQMTTTNLEKAMQNFIQNKIDVLVCTKIVESGLDIPNANTMIINRANNFGLAELYQLRGRVGRTNKQAYCHLLVPPSQKIGRTALQRLQAIEEFTDLGSGYHLAMRDLEIRGAGNLLGAEQSGNIIDLGFELFQKILEEAVKELKIEEFKDVFDSDDFDEKRFDNEELAIEINADALIPKSYISNDSERYEYYKKLYAVRNYQELDNIKNELLDKFGKLPKEVEELFFVIKVRIVGISTGFSRIVIKSNKMIAEFPPDTHEEFYKEAFNSLIEYVQSLPNSKLLERRKKLFLETMISGRDQVIEILWKIKKTLELLDD